MSEESNPPAGEPLEAQANGSQSTPTEEYQVGPGRPPRDTRWQKGCRSPNPRGRPRKDQSMQPDVRKAFERALNKKVAVPRGDRKVLMTRLEIGFEQLLNQFAKGDPRARRDLIQYAGALGIDLLDRNRQTIEEALAPSKQAILDAYVARRSDTGNVAPAARTLAPPELLDDDAADGEATVASPPTAVTEPEPGREIPEPTPEPGKKYPKPFSRMTRSEKQAWFPEWWAKNGEAYEKQQIKKRQVAQPLDQASLGRGCPPPGGFSLTTKKWS